MVDWAWATERLIEVLDVLAWPLVVVLGFILFRRQVGALIGRIAKVKLPGGAEVEFDKLLEKAEAKAPEAKKDLEKAPVPPPKEPKDPKGGKTAHATIGSSAYIIAAERDFENLLRIARTDPNFALAGLRMEIEKMLRDVADYSLNMEHFKDVRGAGQLLAMLVRLEVLPRSVGILLSDVIKLCNAAVHGAVVAEEDALRVISLASDFQVYYRNWMKEAKTKALA